MSEATLTRASCRRSLPRFPNCPPTEWKLPATARRKKRRNEDLDIFGTNSTEYVRGCVFAQDCRWLNPTASTWAYNVWGDSEQTGAQKKPAGTRRRAPAVRSEERRVGKE